MQEMTRPQIYHLMQLKGAVKLEMLGMRHSGGKSACAHAKRVYGIKGSREKVAEYLTKMLELQQNLKVYTTRYDEAYASGNKELLSQSEEAIQTLLEQIGELHDHYKS